MFAIVDESADAVEAEGTLVFGEPSLLVIIRIAFDKESSDSAAGTFLEIRKEEMLAPGQHRGGEQGREGIIRESGHLYDQREVGRQDWGEGAGRSR